MENHSDDTFNSFIKKIYKIWSNQPSFVCLLYSAIKTAGFIDFSSFEELERYLHMSRINMLYIKNVDSDEIQLYRQEMQEYEVSDGDITILLKDGSRLFINGIGGNNEKGRI